MNTVTAVTDATFEAEVLNSEQTIIVDFMADWCSSCSALSPVLDEIAAEHGDKIKILKLNVDENHVSAHKYEISSIPALKVYRKGVVAQTIIGAKPKSALEAELATFLA